MNPRQPRELIVGPFHPTLEDALAERVRRAKADDPGAAALVLVGSNALGVYLRRLLGGRMPLWNVRFFTFAELARRLGSEPLRARGRASLPELAERLLVRRIVREQKTGYFAPVAELPGFADTALASIRDLKEAGLGSSALAGHRDPKLTAFAKIFRSYEGELETLGFCDEADRLAAVEEAADAPLVADAHFVAYGFYDLNGLQRRLALALASHARSASAMVPAGQGPAYEYAGPLLGWFRENGFTESGSAEAGALTERLFRPPESPADEPRPVRILSAPGEPREAREVVRRVLDLAAKGIPFGEIGVLLRNPEGYAQLLRDAFELRGVPCFVAGGVPLAETPEARCLGMLADLLGGGLPRADVMQFIHFAPLALEGLLGRVPRTAAWDRLTIEAGIIDGPEEWTRRLARLEKRFGADERRAEELAGLRTFVRMLIDARASVPASGTWSGLLVPLLAAFERLVQPTEDRDRVLAAARRLGALDTLGHPVTLSQLREAIEQTLQRERRPQDAGFQRGAVCVGGLFELRGVRFRAVIVPGMAERSFPATGRQDPILPDSERAAVAGRAAGDAYLPAKSARPAEERMLFALALDAASDDIGLTFSRLDVTTARERVPSHFLLRLVEALTGRRCDYASLEAAPGFRRVSMFPAGADEGPSVDLDEHDLRTVAGLLASREASKAVYLAEASALFARGLRAEAARWQEKRFTTFDGALEKTPSQGLAAEVIAPTRIEEYARCPFAYFLRHVLGIRRLDEPEALERISPLDRGALIHRVLFDAYSRCFGEGRDASANELTAALRQCAQTAFREVAAPGPALTWALERADILADLDRLAERDAVQRRDTGARPLWFETRFGMPPRGGPEGEASTDRPLELRLGQKTCRFKGRIDRIDETPPDSARVIDYKTGRSSGKANAFDGGRAVQLPLYLLAAETLLPGRRAERAEYWFVTTRGRFRTVPFERKELEARMGDLEQIVTTVEDGIASGLFVATPGKGRCAYCDFAAACGPNRDVLYERKQDDPRIAPLLEMAEIE